MADKDASYVIQVLKDNKLYIPAQRPTTSFLEAQADIQAAVETNIQNVHHAMRSEIGDIFNEENLLPTLYAFYMGEPHALESVPVSGAAASS